MPFASLGILHICTWFLALLKRIAIRRGYAKPNFYVVRLHRRRSSGRHKHFVQTLSPLNYDFWSIIIDVSDRTDQMFKRYPL